jgi:hypothetical protein
MTKEEYFLSEWTCNKEMRAVDQNGCEYYYPAEPIKVDAHAGYREWRQESEAGVQYKEEDVADWWNVSLQTYEEYLELMAAKIMTNE